MLRQFSKRVSFHGCIILYISLFVISCKTDKRQSGAPDRDVTVSAARFEDDLAAHSQEISFLKNKYGSFFDLYTYQLLSMGTPDTALLKTRLGDFVRDPDISVIYEDTRKMFHDFSAINKHLSDAFTLYHFHFPEKIVPQVITFISGFNYAVVCADSILGIGIDLYLGSDSRFYPSLQMPEYKIRKMRKEYITADALRGWAQSDWVQNPAEADLVSQMVYQGKIQYFLDLLMPDVPDSIKFGYTRKQLEWCINSEKSVWSFLVDRKLLFSTEASLTGKFVNDGPTTNGFPKESPGNIGAWVGFRIVQAYMEKHSGISLAQLMDESDSKKIFRDSKYKPAK